MLRLERMAQSWAWRNRSTANIWMYKPECLVHWICECLIQFCCYFSFHWKISLRSKQYLQRSGISCFRKCGRPPQADRQGIFLFLFLFCFFTFNYVKSLPKVVRETKKKPIGLGDKKYKNVAILCLCLRQQMEPIQSSNRRKKLFLLCAAVLGSNSCLHFTAFRNILKVKSCADENKQQKKQKTKTLKCSTFKEAFPCLYCSTTVFCLVGRCKNLVLPAPMTVLETVAMRREGLPLWNRGPGCGPEGKATRRRRGNGKRSDPLWMFSRIGWKKHVDKRSWG